ncbi:unnamed protein product [Didymodactylos carnosus]|uniref:FLYWCH-type domain-containing protein n=1 Tax=Didymodactylos carnosus TaxID=1234261 RepID=A0A815Z037_9BILA|nr:unnamed protein product [Didymodactylos carnosus]CAF1577091.1 unnamed protein product [Didymodactylos carnosus]CAF4284941.1 unnamed protein product [Didymodactylos carnosus]CAF4442653.1 unnamed protein product [Didymodactylos carnosus]
MSTATSASVSCTTKQKPRLELQGFSDIKDRFTENKTYWRWIYYNSQKCHARLHTCNITNNVITPPCVHTCKGNGITDELRKFNEDLWYRTMNTQETPDLIITHCCIGMSDEARLPSHDNIKRRIRMLRQDKKLPSALNDPNFSNVPTALTVTSRGDKFLRCDTGPEAWHHRIGCVFQCVHPTLWSFLQKPIHEEHATHADIVHINSGEAPKHRSKTNERFERRPLNFLLHPHDDILVQLNNIAHNIWFKL